MFQKHQGDDRAGRPIRGWHAAGPGRPGEAGATGVDRPRLTRRSTCTIRRPLPEVGTFKSKRWARRWLGESKPLSKTGCRPGMGSVRRQRVASISDAIGFPSSTRKQHPGPRLRYKHAARARVRIRARSATQRRRPAGLDFSARWVRSARTRWLRFAWAQWVRFAVDGYLFLASCSGELERGFAQRLWPHFLTRFGFTF